jgi:two-component system, OmpR family, alkaline phosphatase synthesis response regulator PhoP
MNKKILVIDDDQGLVKVFALRLKSAGFETETASNGKEGLEKIKESRPTLILLDIQMPEMSGTEMAKVMSSDENLSTIPIIFMTGKVDLEKEDLPKGSHIDIAIKPCDFDELVEKITRLTA